MQACRFAHFGVCGHPRESLRMVSAHLRSSRVSFSAVRERPPVPGGLGGDVRTLTVLLLFGGSPLPRFVSQTSTFAGGTWKPTSTFARETWKSTSTFPALERGSPLPPFGVHAGRGGSASTFKR